MIFVYKIWQNISGSEVNGQTLTASSSWAKLLEGWLALTSVKYHDNLLVLMLFNQWLALIML